MFNRILAAMFAAMSHKVWVWNVMLIVLSLTGMVMIIIGALQLQEEAEKLQTKNAECQARNAEFLTKNMELRVKNIELQAENAELQAKNAVPGYIKAMHDLEMKPSELIKKHQQAIEKFDRLKEVLAPYMTFGDFSNE